jgi:hypothetical protein
MRRLALIVAAAVALVLPAAASAARGVQEGTLILCNASGSPPISGSLTFTVSAPASAGGTQILTVAVGECAPQIFYPVGAPVVVTVNIPGGYTVTAITIGGGAATIISSNAAGGTATVLTGTGQSTLTFTTRSGPAPPPPPAPCRVPVVAGTTVTVAERAIRKAGCAVGHVRKVYSNVFVSGRVTGSSPKHGAVLRHGAPVDVLVSRGKRA